MTVEFVVAQQVVPDFLQEPIAAFIAYLPQLLGALLILVVGWFVGRGVGALVQRGSDAVDLDERVQGTPIGDISGTGRRGVSSALGKIGAWFVYALAFLAAADTLAITTLSNWISSAVSYLPAFVAGLIVILVGFVVADFIGDVIERTRAAAESAYTEWFATGTRLFLYFTAVVIGLDTMGVNVDLLYVFAQAMAWGLAAAIALGVGVAVGWGSKDYVSQHIDQWISARSIPAGGGAGRGPSTDLGGGQQRSTAQTPSAAETPTEETGFTIAQIQSTIQPGDEQDLNDEYVVFENSGREPMELGGSMVTDEEGNTYTFPQEFVLAPGEKVTLHSGSGTDTNDHLYWGSDTQIWDEESDEVRVYDSEERLMAQETYG